MDNSYSTISSHVKGSHLSYGDRILIQIRLKDHCSIRAIAREIGCSPSTVSNEIARGLVALYNGHITRYKASVGQKAYKNHTLPEKLKRKTKTHRSRINKKKLGRSIEERPQGIESREEFGHWECDLVLGAKTRDDQVLFTLAERKSREFLIVPIADKTSACVMAAMKQIQEIYSEHFSEVFKTITTDNGSEFADLAELEKMADTLIYYAHPYTSCDKGTVERHNGLIRQFIPKGKRIDDFTSQQIADVEIWCNCLPRKIFGYRTPDEIFEEELDQIYQITA